VNHFGQLPSVNISFNLAPGVALGDAVARIQAAAAETIPASVTLTFQGAAQAFQDSLRGLGLVLLMAIVVIYIVLGVLYESFTHPLTILSGLPAAGLGALLTLMIFDVDLNLYAFVGVIMLVGLVKKNGIMMVDFALQLQREKNLPPAEAIVEASIIRFRPIMMTTMAAIFATLPLAFGTDTGSEMRQPLGVAVVGGLVFSQLLTLYVTPTFYVTMERLARFFQKRRTAAAAAH
jgi:hydrophobic/amphiphilic exporter-1 (mainly G- bacteria), HAE1 family